MALQWLWSEKCGEATLEQTIDGKKKEFTLNLYTGNAYLIFISEFEQDGQEKYSVDSFWVDKNHMMRCLGLEKGSHNIYSGFQTFTKFRLDMDKCRYWKHIVPALKKAFKDIVIELY